MGNLTWGRRENPAVYGTWPENENGEPETPALLLHDYLSDQELDMTRTMLESFGIATVCRYPNDGQFGTVIMGRAQGGVDIFVPETQLEDAQNILSAPAEEQAPEEE